MALKIYYNSLFQIWSKLICDTFTIAHVQHNWTFQLSWWFCDNDCCVFVLVCCVSFLQPGGAFISCQLWCMRKGLLNTKHDSGTECNVSVLKVVHFQNYCSRSQKFCLSKKSLRISLKIIWKRKKVSESVSKYIVKKSWNKLQFFCWKFAHLTKLSDSCHQSFVTELRCPQ